MKTYITQEWRDRQLWAGPQIRAKSWDAAKVRARILEVELVGYLE